MKASERLGQSTKGIEDRRECIVRGAGRAATGEMMRGGTGKPAGWQLPEAVPLQPETMKTCVCGVFTGGSCVFERRLFIVVSGASCPCTMRVTSGR